MKKHIAAYDYMRIIAILAVLITHREIYVYVETGASRDLLYYLAELISIFAKTGPPLFFMISGALLLKRADSFSDVFKKRLPRFLIVILLCALILIIRYQSFAPSEMIKTVLSGVNWYLYAYVGFLLMLPFLQRMVKGASEKEAIIYLIFVAVYYTITFVSSFKSIEIGTIGSVPIYNAPWALDVWNIIFPISGYMLVILCDKYGSKVLAVLAPAALISVVIQYWLTLHDLAYWGGTNIEMIRQRFNFAITCFIFAAVYVLCKKGEEEKEKKFLSELGAATFGVYLIDGHVGCSEIIERAILDATGAVSPVIMGVAIVLLEWILYSAVVILLRKIPYVKKII